MKKLSDEELDNVAGGFREGNKDLDTYGKEIKCPSCHESSRKGFDPRAFRDPKTGSVEYRCKCGTAFICYEGRVIHKADWIKKCKDKGYQYPFA